MYKKTLVVFTALFFVVLFTVTGCSDLIDGVNGEFTIEDGFGDELDEETYSDDAYYDDEDYADEDYADDTEVDLEDSENNVYSEPEAVIVSSGIKAYDLEDYYLPGIFSMKKPVGWDVYKAGEYNTLAFLTRDETEPLRQVFCFGEIGLFYIDEDQKKLEINYNKNNGYNVPWLDMPVVSPFDGATFFENLDDILDSNIAVQFLTAGGMPKPTGFDSVEIISQEPIDSIIAGFPSVLVRALLVQNGEPAQGLFVVTGSVDGYGHATALLVAGISAPMREFGAVQESMLETIRSFSMDPSYVNKGVQTIQENGERFKAISQTISDTSDIIINGWNARNKTYDIIAEKRSDQILDVERVYDPNDNTVYEVQNGFNDYYQTHKDQYDLKNLLPLPDDDPKPWGLAPILNHDLVIP